eukprot:m.87291 g.87291  ORF g.87291 m.87291 type:complete len:173 (+) comp12825_c0_seq20:91-609(+)
MGIFTFIVQVCDGKKEGGEEAGDGVMALGPQHASQLTASDLQEFLREGETMGWNDEKKAVIVYVDGKEQPAPADQFFRRMDMDKAWEELSYALPLVDTGLSVPPSSQPAACRFKFTKKRSNKFYTVLLRGLQMQTRFGAIAYGGFKSLNEGRRMQQRLHMFEPHCPINIGAY